MLSVYIDRKIISAKLMGYLLQPPVLLALLWEILLLSFSGSVSHKISTRLRWHFQAPYQLNIHATKIVVFMVWIFGFGEYLQQFLLEHQSFSFRFITGQPPVAQSSFLASLMTIAAGVAVYNVFRRFCEPCFHWVATRELRLITLCNPPTGRWYMLKLGTC